MRYLLDTHIVLWLFAGSRRVPHALREDLADPANEVLVSAVSAWEMAIKARLGKLAGPSDVRTWLPAHLEGSGFTPLPITIQHTLGVEHLPLHHTDPFDRLLIAQAIAEQLPIVTADRQFARYGIPVIAC